ncbi:MAG: hypothetical protein A3E37_02370 [Candidatus Andersenbacteria bacterium RIFCSPHIGHO2_12_FULL_46_9]|nr:MAG: hypothetical protein A3E37_02370 [Candidatus Andersenbacteria bacterium RIFCSPHIGHO2_12_FULL_46_9]
MNMVPDNPLLDMQKLQHQLSSFNHQVDHLAKAHPQDILLSLSSENLPLFLATFPAPYKIVVIDQSMHHAQVFTAYLNHLRRLLNVNEDWHFLSGALTEQEITGDICSALSIGVHHLLSSAPNHNFVVPLSLINISLPHPDEYHASQLVWHRNVRVSLAVLIKDLTTLGYRRHRTSIEPGTFLIRGEQLVIKHPLHQGHYTVTLYGPNLEKIEYDSDFRRQTLDKLIIPPVSFHLPSTGLDKIIGSYTIIRPSFVQLFGSSNIVYDALHPTIPFPAITIPLALKPPNTNQPRPISHANGLALLTQLQENKPAVHSDHGIGIFEGMKQRTINNYTKDYLILRYAAGDTLSVPVEYAYKVSPYLGNTTPIIHRLGSQLWQKSRRHAQRDAAAFARELLKNEALRQQTTRPYYHLDPSLDDWLNKSFPYELTPDQASAWQDIRHDLTQATPMDRLVIGDVGFGKTELAIRAACHTMNNKQQVAILAPTTILEQHYDLFASRLPHLTKQLATLSRFSTAADRQAVREKIATGQVSIVIGTHALLSKSTLWHNLGLVVIDEEQRFGVAHKEHFKKLRSRLDILSLTATPIPRTLSMALSHLKQLSVINTAPPGRKSIFTWVGRDSDIIIKQALDRELKRHGQIYVIAPKIRQLSALAHRIASSSPTARLALLHGQMSSQQIASTMQQFDHRQIDILISSTIIANGLDLPCANTIIVTHATHFGLSDLYQLRGRIGRRKQQGYALFLYNQTELTSIQRQRLTALTEASRLGSGWSLARRDLEIRGAGNLLGEQQSGSVNAVGVQLYLDMVHDAIDQTTGSPAMRHDININLPISAHIPTSYLPELSQRTSYYQKLSRSRTLDILSATIAEITNQFGPPPVPLTNLYYLLQIQHLAALHQVLLIDTRSITPSHQPPFYRIVLSFHHLPLNDSLAARLPEDWSINNNQLVLTTAAITPHTLQEIIIMLNILGGT